VDFAATADSFLRAPSPPKPVIPPQPLLSVRDTAGRKVTTYTSVAPGQTVLDLKRHIHEHCGGVPLERQQLYLPNGTILGDSKMLIDIPQGTVLEVMQWLHSAFK